MTDTNTDNTGIIHIAAKRPIWIDSVHALCGKVFPLERKKPDVSKLTRCPNCAAKLESMWDRPVIEHK